MKFSRLLIVSLITLVVAFVSPAYAGKPDFETVQIDETFLNEQLTEACGVPIETHGEGFIKFSTHYDRDGDVAFELNSFHLKETFTNVETGTSISTVNVGPDRVTFAEDGTVILAQIGVLGRFVIPGEGLIGGGIGKVVTELTFDEAGNLVSEEVVFEAGIHEDVTSELCAVLAA